MDFVIRVRRARWLSLPLLVAGCFSAASCCPATSSAPSDEVQFDNYSQRIEQLGGKVALELDFSGTSINDEDLANVRLGQGVTSINLTGSNVTDAGLAHLMRAKNLRKINLAHTEITDAGLALLKELPKLEQISLSHTNTTRKARLEMFRLLASRRPAEKGRRGS